MPLISRSAALDTNYLNVDGAKKPEHRNQHAAVSTGRSGRADRRARHSVSDGLIWLAAHRSRPERHVAPLSMLGDKSTMPSTLLWGAAPRGASASRSWAAASITGAFAGGVKSATTKSKLPKVEADTVPSNGELARTRTAASRVRTLAIAPDQTRREGRYESQKL